LVGLLIEVKIQSAFALTLITY